MNALQQFESDARKGRRQAAYNDLMTCATALSVRVINDIDNGFAFCEAPAGYLWRANGGDVIRSDGWSGPDDVAEALEDLTRRMGHGLVAHSDDDI